MYFCKMFRQITSRTFDTLVTMGCVSISCNKVEPHFWYSPLSLSIQKAMSLIWWVHCTMLRVGQWNSSRALLRSHTQQAGRVSCWERETELIFYENTNKIRCQGDIWWIWWDKFARQCLSSRIKENKHGSFTTTARTFKVRVYQYCSLK